MIVKKLKKKTKIKQVDKRFFHVELSSSSFMGVE